MDGVGGNEQEREARTYPVRRASPPMAAEAQGLRYRQPCFRRAAERYPYQRPPENLDGKGRNNQSGNLPHQPPHVRNDAAHAWSRPLYRLQTVGTFENQEHAGLRRNHQPTEGRGGKPHRQNIRLELHLLSPDYDKNDKDTQATQGQGTRARPLQGIKRRQPVRLS